MFYSENFKKYRAFHISQQLVFATPDVRIVNLCITPEALARELRVRFPEFFPKKV